MSPPHRKQSIDLKPIGQFLSEAHVGVKRIKNTFLFQKSEPDVFFQTNAQSSLLFGYLKNEVSKNL